MNPFAMDVAENCSVIREGREERMIAATMAAIESQTWPIWPRRFA